ncbi:MAG: GNAT family N-acetyltransferase [Proteobacteria bacterium]|nr:GNAT family N-acetyltransferase [Pseudomonadota bacterium]
MTERHDAQRIFMRPLEEADIDPRYVAWFTDIDVTRFIESRNFSADDSKAYLRAGRETRSYFIYAVCLSESQRHIGNLKIGPINWTHGVADLVTVIGDKSCWGQGFAAEAIALGSRVAFKSYGLRKLHGAILADNIGSIKAYTRGGWSIVGRLHAHYLVEGRPMDAVLVSCFADPPAPPPS